MRALLIKFEVANPGFDFLDLSDLVLLSACSQLAPSWLSLFHQMPSARVPGCRPPLVNLVKLTHLEIDYQKADARSYILAQSAYWLQENELGFVSHPTKRKCVTCKLFPSCHKCGGKTLSSLVPIFFHIFLAFISAGSVQPQPKEPDTLAYGLAIMFFDHS